MAGKQEVHKQDGREVGDKTRWQGSKRYIKKMAGKWPGKTMSGKQEVHKQDGREVGGKTRWQGSKRYINKMAGKWVVKQDGREARGT
jgi:hypothetical protein